MLLTRPVLEAIRAGELDLVFRRWRRPTVRAGGRLRTAIGELDIHEVDVVDRDRIDDSDARRAGYPDARSLVDDLFHERPVSTRARTAHPAPDSPIYRVRVTYRGEDTRVALRQQLLDPTEVDALVRRLAAIDTRAAQPWAVQALQLIQAWPERRAPELAELAGWTTAPWKANVRRLKELGLTESLPVGYRLSPRGAQVVAALDGRSNPSGPAAH